MQDNIVALHDERKNEPPVEVKCQVIIENMLNVGKERWLRQRCIHHKERPWKEEEN